MATGTLLTRAQEGKHLHFLDALRGAAVSYVLLYHFLPKTISIGNDSILAKVWDAFWLMGWSGVDLFFVLSGFLITGILHKTKHRKNYFKHFYIRRFFRIFPAYYVLIIIAILYFGSDDIGMVYWLYLSNFDVELNIPFNLFLCVAWSLSIEEQYYLFYPTVVYYLSDQRWIHLLVGFIILSISLRFFGHYFEFFIPRQMYHNTLAHFDGIALGGLIRMMILNYDSFKKTLKWYVALTPVIVIAAICLAYYCGMAVLDASVDSEGVITKLQHVSFYPTMYLYGYALNAMAFGGIILWCIFKGGWVLRFFSNPVLRDIGKYSYAMYLFQYPAYTLYKYVTGTFGITFNPYVKALLLFALVYLVARLSWVLIEAPMNRIKDRLTK